MTEQDMQIKQMAVTGQVDGLSSMLAQIAEHPVGEVAGHLETAWLKYGSHQLFVRTKGDVSAIHDSLPDLTQDDSNQALDKYSGSVVEYLRLFNQDLGGLIGTGLDPEEARKTAIEKLAHAAEEWKQRGVKNVPVKGQLAVLADKPWDNNRLREVIAENWAGGVKQGLWAVAGETSSEAKERLQSGEPAADVDAWYQLVANETFDEVMGVIDRAISETQPDQPKPEGDGAQ